MDIQGQCDNCKRPTDQIIIAELTGKTNGVVVDPTRTLHLCEFCAGMLAAKVDERNRRRGAK
jgi:hypothetical protein